MINVYYLAVNQFMTSYPDWQTCTGVLTFSLSNERMHAVAHQARALIWNTETSGEG